MIIGACCFCMLVYCVYASQVFVGEAARRSEISKAVSHSILQTLEVHKKEPFETEAEMEAYCCQMLESEIVSSGKLQVYVMEADIEYGMLDLIVSQQYKGSNEKEREITVRKCGIIDQL